jgi:ketosteroid isomerase-like protein/Tfp pilus assembly protein PilF
MTRASFSFLLVGVLVASPVRAQMLPVTTASEEARAHFELGRDAAFHYQFAEAVEHLDAAISADPAFVLAYLMRGGSSTRLERGPYFELARAHQDRVTPAEQQLVDAFHAFLWDDDIDRAVEILTRLDEEHPNDPYVAMWLGLRYLRNLGLHERARERFASALHRDSTTSQAHYWIGQTELALGDVEAAAEAFARYVELSPNQPRPWHALGQLHLVRGELDAAAAMFERSSEVDRRFSPGLEALIRLRIGQVNRELEMAIARRDAAAAAAAYALGADMHPPVGGARSGLSEIEEFWDEILGAGVSDAHLETVEVYVGDVGNVATEVGRYRLTGGGDSERAGTYIVIWARTADGWKRYRDIWTSDGAVGR